MRGIRIPICTQKFDEEEFWIKQPLKYHFNPLNAKLNLICHLLALLGGATIVVVSRLRVKVDIREAGLKDGRRM
jgi:hypothetical protein